MARPRKYKTKEEALRAQREQQKAWNLKNKDKNLEYQHKRYETKEGRAYQLAAAYNQLDTIYRSTASLITPEFILTNIFTSKCVYCGEDDWSKLGCDRVDNTKPHTPDNVVCSCGKCNVKKRKLSPEEYRQTLSNNS